MATIKPRRGTTAPTTGLVQNELAVDTTNKRIYIGNAGGGGDLIGSAPGGSNTQVQFNDSGNLGGDAGLTYNKTTDTLTSGSISTTGLEVKTVGGDEGGQIDFGLAATNTTLNSGVAIDVYQNRLRMYEKGGTSRGVYIDLTAAGGGVGTNLLASSASPGGSDTYVQFNDGGSAFGGDAGLTYNKTTDSLTITGDLAVNGGDVTTTSATATLFNTNATTLSVGGEATTLNIGTTTISAQTIQFGTNTTGSIFKFFGGSGALEAAYVATKVQNSIYFTTGMTDFGFTGASGSMGYGCSALTNIGDWEVAGNGTLIAIDDTSSAISCETISFSLNNAAEIRFMESTINGSNYVGFKAPTTLSGNRIWTLPSADGTNGQVLSTNGSGTLSWSSAGGGSGTVTSITPAADTGTGTAITTSGTITISGTANEIETSVSGTTVTIGLPDLVATSAVGGILSLINQGII